MRFRGDPGPVQPDPAQREQHDGHGGADDGGIGQVQDRSVRQLDPVDDVPLEEFRRAEDPVEQAAGGPAEQQAERDG